MRRLCLGLTLALGLAAGSAAAAEVALEDLTLAEGRHLLNLCAAGREDQLYLVARSMCTAFILGASGAHDFLTRNTKAALYCKPEGMELNDAIGIYLRWARENPDRLDRAPAEGLFAALNQALACER